jgi:uncharacterized protein (UPF0276 family)
VTLAYLGHGVGLRVPHYERALRGALEVDWVEVITENFFGGGGRPRAVLEAVRRERPLVFHGVSLGVGDLGAPDLGYLRQVKALADALEPAWLSDHVCWTRFDGRYSHELLPLPCTREALDTAVANTERAQDFLKRPLVLENVSSYVAHRHGDMTEWEFLAELARRSGCSLLLDLNNVLVSAYNHGFAPSEYLAGLPSDKVAQFHLANHTQHARYKLDDHRGPVPAAVWELFEAAIARFGAVSSLVEWDEELPAWEVLVAERDQAAARARRVQPGERCGQRAREPAPRGAAGDAAQPHRVPGSLEHTQRLFFDALTWPRGVRDFAARASDAVRRELEDTFAGDQRLDPIARLDIYANAYFYRLLDVLRDLFPRLAYLAGEVPFHNLVTDYLLAYPSTAPDLRRLGERLPAFVLDHPLGQHTPLLPEVAELELGLASALDAPDSPLFMRSRLAELAASEWPALELELAPSVRLTKAAHDLTTIAALCDDRQRERALATPPAAEQTALLIGRRGHAVYFRALEPRESLTLEKIKGGTRFATLCEALGPHDADPARLAEYLMRWVDDGVVAPPGYPSETGRYSAGPG